MLSWESLVEFPRELARETFGAGENQVNLAIILDQPDHTSGFSNPIGRWCSQCDIPAGNVPDCFVCLCVPGYGHQYAEEIGPPRNQLYFPLSKPSKHVPVSFSAHCILRQQRLSTCPPIALKLAASVLLLNSFCPYTWPFEHHCPLFRLLGEN